MSYTLRPPETMAHLPAAYHPMVLCVGDMSGVMMYRGSLVVLKPQHLCLDGADRWLVAMAPATGRVYWEKWWHSQCVPLCGIWDIWMHLLGCGLHALGI